MINRLDPDALDVERRDASFGQQGSRWQSTLITGTVDVVALGDEPATARLDFDDPNSRYSRPFVHRPAVFFDSTTDDGVRVEHVNGERLRLAFDPTEAAGDTLAFALLAVGAWEERRGLFE